jgi:hypothetical protein
MDIPGNALRKLSPGRVLLLPLTLMPQLLERNQNGAQILRRSRNTRSKKPAEEDNSAQQPRNIKGSAEGTHAQDHPQPTQPTTSTGSVVSQQAPSEGSSDSLIAEAQPNRISSHPYQYNLHSNVSMASLAARRGRRYSHRHGDGTAASGLGVPSNMLQNHELGIGLWLVSCGGVSNREAVTRFKA